MAQNEVDNINKVFPIYYDSSGTDVAFHNLVLHKATVESIVMSLGDKISGDVYYKDNTLDFIGKYIYLDGVKYVIVNPATVVREGLVKDNSGLNGMTKYSLTFYHPMYMLSNFAFTDVAVSIDEEQYLSANKTFSWIGNLFDFIAKLNKNLQGTQWLVWHNIQSNPNDVEYAKASKMSDVLSFDKQFISDALKVAYDTWEVPFTIASMSSGRYFYTNNHSEQVDFYDENKRFVIEFGLPSNTILDSQGREFVFKFGQGVGLKNNSRTPKNNKIITRIVGYGSERNIQYGYPQIPWEGNDNDGKKDWDYTINNSANEPNSYPIYKGIYNGQLIRLIKHPFTRSTLMPSRYVDDVNNKVNPYAADYNPDIEIHDYYDAIDEVGGYQYPNNINTQAPSVEIHQFEDIYPRLMTQDGEDMTIINAVPINTNEEGGIVTEIPTIGSYIETLRDAIDAASNQNEKDAIQGLSTFLYNVNNYPDALQTYYEGHTGGSYTYNCVVQPKGSGYPDIYVIEYTSDSFNAKLEVTKGSRGSIQWEDSYNVETDEYKQSYFKVTLPPLGFDLYACASITQSMQINMRSGACNGCTFDVMVDWDSYKKNFYNSDGEFDPEPHTTEGDGHPRNITKFPDSTNEQIELICKKDIETFGTLMPNIYQQITGFTDDGQGDAFVILGISLPQECFNRAQAELDSAMKEYMLENNVHYYDYPLKFDEYFLTTHRDILAQIKNNNVVSFLYTDGAMKLYIKQITIKYGESVLPQYDITLTDDVEIVLNKIGQVTDDVSKLRVQFSELQKYYSSTIIEEINSKLSRLEDDIAQGRITFQQGLDALGNIITNSEIKSNNFNSGLYTGSGWRIDQLGNAELESLRVRSFLEVVELLINRIQAQEGDTLFTDNDQVDKVEPIRDGNNIVAYKLSLKQKYDGYISPQIYGNILKGTINTLAAKQARVSDINGDAVGQETDGKNVYYTSWMRVIETHNTCPKESPRQGRENYACDLNQIVVVLYGDDDVPAARNFAPCELMVVARWGHIDFSSDLEGFYALEGYATNERIQAEVDKRQRLFYISNSEGRIVKLRDVSQPKLTDWNYGTTLGTLPDFITDGNSSVSERLLQGRDYLYAQGIVVGDLIEIATLTNPVVNYIDCGLWVDGAALLAQGETPTPRHGIYYYEETNQETHKLETHDVWHNGFRWRCLQHQPVETTIVISGVAHTENIYYEPTWGSYYWEAIEGDGSLTLEFESSRGYSFHRYNVNTTVTAHLYYGGIEITNNNLVEFVGWERCLASQINDDGTINYSELTGFDNSWNRAHQNGVSDYNPRTLTLTNDDMPSGWSSADKAVFTLTVNVRDNNGNVTTLQNQIIA